MESSQPREFLNEVLLVARGISFQSAAIFLCPKGTTQISHGTRTKYRKTRAMQRDFTIVDSLALRAVRVKPISCALRACFLGHYRMARMSQSASSCGLASWMRPQQLRHFYGSKCSFAKIAIPCTIYLSLNSYPSYIYQHRSTDLLLGCTFLQYTTHKYYICDAPASLPFYKKFKHPHTVDEYSHKSNERKTLTVLRRNSIIIVNCSAEYI